MKYHVYFLLLLMPLTVNAAAPDDISNNQRAWFDAVDLNGDGDYTDNPTTAVPVSQWNDKSGLGHHISATGSQRPTYRFQNLSAERHGVGFDGSNDRLINTNDIWTGSVSNSESFIVATTDQVLSSFLFSSTDTGSNRLGAHAPWSNSITYFDQGSSCCGAPMRLSGSVPITLNRPYFWHFIGLTDQQSVLQDGNIYLNDTGAGTYIANANTVFVLGGMQFATFHRGRYYEALFYQTRLNNAQRRIINSYLSAKWNKVFGTSPAYADVYNGDVAVQGHYDYFVGGIGQDNGTQVTGTSQGLTITDDSFLDEDGKFILAGVNYLVTPPITGTTTDDLPSGYVERSNRSWYIDRTGDGGLVNLAFDASTIGIPVDDGASYGLLHRVGTTGPFTPVATATMAGGVVTFNHLPDDGVYTLAKLGVPVISLEKTNQTVKDPINNLVNPKAIPNSNIDYTLTVKNQGNVGPDMDTTLLKDTLQSELTLFTGNLDGSGSPFVFTDNNCPPETNTLSSNLTLDYPADVVFRNSFGNPVTPALNYDATIRSFEITLSGLMNLNSGSGTPCFTIRYRTLLE